MSMRKILATGLMIGLVGLVAAPVWAVEEQAGSDKAALADKQAGDATCPWKIKQIAVEKWGNGKIKRALRAKGSFPINIPGVTERPDWFVNGTPVGKSQIFFNLRTVYGGYNLRDKAENTVTVRFNKPPYNGASNTYKFYFDSSKVAPGGQRWF